MELFEEGTLYESLNALLHRSQNTFAINRKLMQKAIDVSWVEAIENGLPHLDTVLRTPRKTIEDVARFLGTTPDKTCKAVFYKHFDGTLIFACIIFFFIGAPLGTIIRRGGLGLPVVISVLFFVIYHIISTVSERMAEYGDMNMFLGVWLSTLIIFPIGLFLTIKATTDSALMDGESWSKFFRQFIPRKKKNHEDTTPL